MLCNFLKNPVEGLEIWMSYNDHTLFPASILSSDYQNKTVAQKDSVFYMYKEALNKQALYLLKDTMRSGKDLIRDFAIFFNFIPNWAVI